MNLVTGIGLGIMGTAGLAALIGFCFYKTGTQAIDKPPVYDGAGGKDMQNLMVGVGGTCFGPMVMLIAAAIFGVGSITAVVGLCL